MWHPNLPLLRGDNVISAIGPHEKVKNPPAEPVALVGEPTRCVTPPQGAIHQCEASCSAQRFLNFCFERIGEPLGC